MHPFVAGTLAGKADWCASLQEEREGDLGYSTACDSLPLRWEMNFSGLIVALKDPKGAIKKYFASHVGRVRLGLGLMDWKQMVARGPIKQTWICFQYHTVCVFCSCILAEANSDVNRWTSK